jgi:hypothetical protein
MFRIIHFLKIKGQLLSLCDRRISSVEFFKMKTHFIRFSFSVNTSMQNGVKKKEIINKTLWLLPLCLEMSIDCYTAIQIITWKYE